MPERKIGEQFEFDGFTLKCEKDEGMCEGCFFDMEKIACANLIDIVGPCCGECRSDVTNVIFRLIKQEDKLCQKEK